MRFSDLRRIHANNVSTFGRDPLSEISGSLGDLGTLLPLMIALAVNNSISLSTTLVFSGIWNILTGVVFGIPLPVQPMKAIAAVAIARKFTIAETVSAGFFVAVCVLIFSITGLLRWFTRVIPTPVVKGIQVGAGLSLVLSAGSSLLQPLGWTSPNWVDNRLWALFAFISLLATLGFPRIPYALIIFTLGILFSIFLAGVNDLPALKLWHPITIVPSLAALKTGALDAGLGQLPLTTLNSIIAVCYLSSDLLPHIAAPSVTAMGISVAGMNLVGAWFGAMPVCHGSGGLAAQYRFGARSGASIILLGSFKVLLGIFFGETLVGLLRQYPKSLLGIMVLAAGLELAKVGESLNHGARDLWEASESRLDGEDLGEGGFSGVKVHRKVSDAERRERWTVMMMTVGGLLAFKNDAVGFAAGMLSHWTYSVLRAWDVTTTERNGWLGSITRNRNREEGEERLL